MDNLSIKEKTIIYYSMLACNSLSIIGCLFICVVFIICKTLHQYSFKMIFILSLFDIGSSVAFLIPTYDRSANDSECMAQAIILNFFTLSGVLWTTYIAISLYSIIVRNNMFFEKYFKHTLVFIIVICLIVTMIPYFTESYGRVSGWCWINSDRQKIGFFERLFLFFIPLWLFIIFNLSLYIIIIRKMSTNLSDESVIKSLSKKLTYYPITLVICFLPYTLKALLEIFDYQSIQKYEFILTLVSGISRSIVGFLNAIVYGNTKKIKRAIKQRLSGEYLSLENFENSARGRKRLGSIKSSQCTVFFGTFVDDETS